MYHTRTTLDYPLDQTYFWHVYWNMRPIRQIFHEHILFFPTWVFLSLSQRFAFFVALPIDQSNSVKFFNLQNDSSQMNKSWTLWKSKGYDMILNFTFFFIINIFVLFASAYLNRWISYAQRKKKLLDNDIYTLMMNIVDKKSSSSPHITRTPTIVVLKP